MPEWGGARSGAGRPVVPPADKKKKRSLYLDDHSWQKVVQLAKARGISPGELLEIFVSGEPPSSRTET